MQILAQAPCLIFPAGAERVYLDGTQASNSFHMHTANEAGAQHGSFQFTNHSASFRMSNLTQIIDRVVLEMVVRIRFGKGPKVQRKRGKNRRAALAFASLLTPAAVMTAVLGIWRLAADLQWASNFAIRNGLFSHWQVWMVSAGLLQTGSHLLNRYGRAADRAA
jgi:hypothetical protein